MNFTKYFRNLVEQVKFLKHANGKCFLIIKNNGKESPEILNITL